MHFPAFYAGVPALHTGIAFTICLLHPIAFSEKYATAKCEYFHASVERVRCRQQTLLRDDTPG